MEIYECFPCVSIYIAFVLTLDKFLHINPWECDMSLLRDINSLEHHINLWERDKSWPQDIFLEETKTRTQEKVN